MTGNWKSPLYAVSVPGVKPSACASWFQAEQACALSGKRLVTNQEWQRAAAGTPDPGSADDGATTCATNSPSPSLTGARTACVSAWGAHDMVGNVSEWTADWDEQPANCTVWPSAFGDDRACVGGGGGGIPGALIRGGDISSASSPGVFAVGASVDLSIQGNLVGFRCAR